MGRRAPSTACPCRSDRDGTPREIRLGLRGRRLHSVLRGGQHCLDLVVSPGDNFEVAVFAINGPISAAPANFLWFREAKFEFFR